MLPGVSMPSWDPPLKSPALNPHLHVAVGEEEVDDDVQAEQLHAVQALLDAGQLPAQLLAPEHLPRPADVAPDRLPKIAAAGFFFWGGRTQT